MNIKLILGGVALIAGYFIIKHKEIGKALDATVAAVNPMDENNIANQAANGIYHAVGGSQDSSIGTGIYDGVQSVKQFFGFGTTPVTTQKNGQIIQNLPVNNVDQQSLYDIQSMSNMGA